LIVVVYFVSWPDYRQEEKGLVCQTSSGSTLSSSDSISSFGVGISKREALQNFTSYSHAASELCSADNLSKHIRYRKEIGWAATGKIDTCLGFKWRLLDDNQVRNTPSPTRPSEQPPPSSDVRGATSLSTVFRSKRVTSTRRPHQAGPFKAHNYIVNSRVEENGYHVYDIRYVVAACANTMSTVDS
jgi:hypothetical protein